MDESSHESHHHQRLHQYVVLAGDLRNFLMLIDSLGPVVSSSNIPTIPLTVAQAMNPAPRPPSPTAREATQRAHRRENPNQLSSRDAQILMSLPPNHKANGHSERARVDSFFTESSSSGQDSTPKKSPKVSAPPRPSRETRRISTSQSDFVGKRSHVLMFTSI